MRSAPAEGGLPSAPGASRVERLARIPAPPRPARQSRSARSPRGHRAAPKGAYCGQLPTDMPCITTYCMCLRNTTASGEAVRSGSQTIATECSLSHSIYRSPFLQGAPGCFFCGRGSREPLCLARGCGFVCGCMRTFLRLGLAFKRVLFFFINKSVHCI
jgi:hypothetical protein